MRLLLQLSYCMVAPETDPGELSWPCRLCCVPLMWSMRSLQTSISIEFKWYAARCSTRFCRMRCTGDHTTRGENTECGVFVCVDFVVLVQHDPSSAPQPDRPTISMINATLVDAVWRCGAVARDDLPMVTCLLAAPVEVRGPPVVHSYVAS